MDVVTFDVEDIRVCLPYEAIVLSPVLDDSRMSVNDSGSGTLNSTIHVVNLRRKFGFSTMSGDQGTRLLTAEISGRTVGLVLDRFATVELVRNAKIKPIEKAGQSYIVGVVADKADTIFLLDWDEILAEDDVLDINELFSLPAVEQTGSNESDFLVAISSVNRALQSGVTSDEIRRTAKKFGIPLSVANRLVTFHFPRM